MERTYIKDLKEYTEKEVSISGHVDVRRDQGKMVFFEFRDMTGKVQGVVLPNNEEALEVSKEIRPEWIVEVQGMVNKRPERNVQEGKLNGDIELEVKKIVILNKAKELPFEKDADINIDTYLDNMPLTLRTEKAKAIFKVQATIVKAFREFFDGEGFTEFQAPKLIGDDAEGGANAFSLEYFGHTAHLAQSPQLYKQIMVGVFERVYAIGNVYRAEKHATTRHINEYTSMDAEFGFIKDHMDVIRMENKLMIHIMKKLKEVCSDEFKLLEAKIPNVLEETPTLKLVEAQEILKKEYDADCVGEPDLEPQHERWLCEYAKKEYNSDFIFITHFPVSKRPFYTYEDETDPGYTKGADLLFRGIEITTLAQRIHDYDTLVASMEKKGLDPKQFSFYLQAFKYGIPPHGGFGLGLERLTAKLLGLDSVKEATLFPRDLNRIDTLLSGN